MGENRQATGSGNLAFAWGIGLLVLALAGLALAQPRALVLPKPAPAPAYQLVKVEWAGTPPATITNRTTGQGWNAGSNTVAVFRVPAGSSNQFVVQNAIGSAAIVVTNAAPTNAIEPVLNLELIQLVTLTWTANSNNAGRVHRLLESPAGTPVGVWSNIYSVTPTNGQRLTLTRTNAGAGRFYRVILP